MRSVIVHGNDNGMRPPAIDLGPGRPRSGPGAPRRASKGDPGRLECGALCPVTGGVRTPMKKFLSVALAAGALVVAACGGSATPAPATTAPESAPAASAPAESASNAAGTGLVGIAMPTKSSERWIPDGDAVKAARGAGLQDDLQYAENDIPTQVSQIENMITKGAEGPRSSPRSTAPRSPTCCRRPRTRASRSSPTTA